MWRRSVTVVIAPITKSVRYMLSSICPRDCSAMRMLPPVQTPQTASARLLAMLTVERTNAGMMAIDMSKHEKFPRRTPPSRRVP